MTDHSESLHAQRTEIAGHVHDRVIPPLFAARMQLESMSAKVRAAIDSNQSLDLRALLTSIDRSAEFVIQAMTAGRQLLNELVPPASGKDYWDQQLELVGDLLATRVLPNGHRPGLTVVGEFQGDAVSAETAVVLTNIVTEAIRNAIRHSQASRIDVSIQPGKSPSGDSQATLPTIRIADNGVGFDSQNQTPHHGMMLMKARAKSIGADLQIESKPGGPTEVVLSWPAIA